MIYQVEYKEKKAAPDGTTYNEFPRGWAEITQKDFTQGPMFRYMPRYVEPRQMYAVQPETGLRGGKMTDATLYWFEDGTGVAMVSDFWKGTIRYFAFGCKHEYKDLPQKECASRIPAIYHAGRCYSVSECKKCLHILAVDSSG
jgi:hypothetical protein